MPPVADPPGSSTRLLLPAIRGHVGDWAFYTCLLPFGEISDRVGFASDMRRSVGLGKIIQRALTPNAERIATYLSKQPQRFLSSLVIAVDGGEPMFHELAVRHTLTTSPSDLPELVEMNMGVLELRGDERLMAVDGQHRVKGIGLAVDAHRRLANDQVTVILVRHDETPAGVQRTRRLFTTLNRYAKPVSKRDLIAQDEDDVVAIVVRDVIDAEPLLRNRVSAAVGNSLPLTDRRNITTLPALYDALDLVVRDRSRPDWSRYKRFRPPDAEIKSHFTAARAFWSELVSSVEVLQRLQDSPDLALGPEHRGPEGGHVLLRPIGLVAFASATRLLMDQGWTISRAIHSVARAPLDLAAPPWPMVLWNPALSRMLYSKENQKLAGRWLALAAGALETPQLQFSDLERDLRGMAEERAGAALEVLAALRASAEPTTGT